ncbi:hypothetical protein Dsin_023535 [Dipteronia sinensis]|uniref:Polygalacturonase n=1 Tax=Dipteronia sinensis TaxID=43782 RepID=A0AAE0A441_9ROSI|nr:hypothetical protein Dsin_023535 [Dipteronia sinensis]
MSKLPIFMTCLLIFAILLITFSTSSSAIPVTFNVADLGARPDGTTDSTQAFVNAWARACGSTVAATIYVPLGRFLLRNVVFNGKDCKNNNIVVRIDGTLVAPADYNFIRNVNHWIFFEHVDGVSVLGGIFDSQGAGLWTCKRAGHNGCPNGATTLGFSKSKNITINGLTSVNSKMYHIDIDNCKNVEIQGVRVTAPGDSPNTDGIHIQSDGVTILNSIIATGDDCISIGPGTTNLWIQNVICGPGHGISVGSLGKKLQEAGVENVTVKSVTFRGTENGVRIKSWGRPSNGFSRNIVFEHVLMIDVQNPIIIDQNYCPDSKHCPHKASGVQISDVTNKDIHGTSASEVAVKFACSSKHPCFEITVEDVNLTYKNQQAQSSCSDAFGSASGLILPAISCL